MQENMLYNMLGWGVTYMCISFRIINKLPVETDRMSHYVIIYSKTKAYSHNCVRRKRRFVDGMKMSHLSGTSFYVRLTHGYTDKYIAVMNHKKNIMHGYEDKYEGCMGNANIYLSSV